MPSPHRSGPGGSFLRRHVCAVAACLFGPSKSRRRPGREPLAVEVLEDKLPPGAVSGAITDARGGKL